MLQCVFQLLFAAWVSTYVWVWRLAYDENDVACEYSRRHRNGDVLFASLAMLLLGAWAIPCICHESYTAAMAATTVVALCLMVPLWIVMNWRADRLWAVASARYMERKYGVDYQRVMQLVVAWRAYAFPIVAFEATLALSEEQRAAPVLGDEAVRARVCEELERLHTLLKQHRDYESSAQVRRAAGDINRMSNSALCHRINKAWGETLSSDAAVKKSE